MVPFEILAASRCEKLRAPSYINLVVSILLVLGILISYLPQHYRIISRRTSEGISPLFVLLGTTSGTCSFANILALPESRADVACCKAVSTFQCLSGLLGIAQVGIQWFSFTIILLLFLIFFPRGSTSPDSSTVRQPNWGTALAVAAACLLHGLVVILISAALLISRPAELGTWANVLGIMAACLAAVQYLPQIWVTYQLGSVLSLSIPMMVIQTPGSFVFAASLASRLGIGGWSTWGVFLVTGSLQGCLLCMGIYFEYQKRKSAESDGNTNPDGEVATEPHNSEHLETDDEGHTVVENGKPNERTPLLGRRTGSSPA